jgi:hypothetical protein
MPHRAGPSRSTCKTSSTRPLRTAARVAGFGKGPCRRIVVTTAVWSSAVTTILVATWSRVRGVAVSFSGPSASECEERDRSTAYPAEPLAAARV